MYRAITRLVLSTAVVMSQASVGIIAATGVPSLSAQASSFKPAIAQAQSAAPVLALDPDGLRLVNPTTGTTRAVPFGMKEADVVSIVTKLQGKPQGRGTNPECGAGPLAFAQWNDGLSLQFQKGRFVGWGVNGRNKSAKRLTTIGGIGIGSTRSDLEATYTIKVSQTSLGTEFSTGSLSGVLSGSKRNARITNLWSGTTCIFR